MNLINLNSFLKFGYFLDYKNPNIKLDFSGIDKEKYKNTTEKELIDIGIKLWKKTIQKQFKTNEKHVVPLSGGLDSRAILATLLEFTESKNIFTYTFGTPGTLDYDIGNLVAKKVGTNHTCFPLNDYVFSINKEIDVAKRIDLQTFLFHHPPLERLDELYTGYIFWSGYILDWFAGSHMPNFSSLSENDAKKYIYKKDTFVKSIDLINVESTELINLFDCVFIDRELLSFEEQIEACHHLLKYTAPHILYKGFDYKLPAIIPELYLFFLSQKEHHRKSRNLFIKMFLKEYPAIFKLPTKTNMGLSLNLGTNEMLIKKFINKITKQINKIHPFFINKNVNYINFEKGIRERQDLKKIIYESIMDLKKRKIVDWIDIDSIWERHIKKQVDHSDVLLVLASLEIHLKAGKQI